MTTIRRRAAAWWLAAAAAATAPAHAQMFKDGALEALFAAERWADIDRMAAQRLAADPADAQAVLAAGLGALRFDDARRRQAAIDQAEACLKREPKAAACHYTLGSVLGVQAMNEGMVAVARHVGRVRSALQEAHALEPAWYAARGALVDFYLLAPSLAGGSSTKALEMARAAPNPDHARALEARVALDAKDAARALQLLAQVRPGGEVQSEADRRQWAATAAFMLLAAGQPEPARAHFERWLREQPGDAMGAYGLGRVASEAGAHAEALQRYEQARALRGSDALPIDYRAGMAQQALGQGDAARASFGRYVAAGKGTKSSIDDAKKRLGQLKG